MDKENNIGESFRVETCHSKRTSTESTIESLSERKEENKQNMSMDSFVTVRPPRDQKLNQFVATIGSSNSTTNQKHHLQSKIASIDRHRSTSQPRQSQTAESMTPIPMENSIRSVSQPRASQNAHFLDGFNVAGCFDVRTIPDPPPPSPSNSRKRHRRRVSSAVLRPMSSMDVNNRENNQIMTSNHATDSDIKSNFLTRRKRKTLSHVPSPLNPEGGKNIGVDSTIYTNDNGKEENCVVEARPECSQINLCRDDYEDERAKFSPKRKKKRQSIVIPRHLPLEVNDSSPGTALVNDFHSKSHSDKKSALKAKKEFTPLDFKSMQKLRNLVRGYCAQSPGDNRGSSKEAKEILSISGYTLPRKISIADGCNKSEAVLSNRRLVIQKIAPVLSQMETRKKRDTKLWENKTECRVTKSDRSGRYKYYDIESNKKVGSQEYKRRYISVLEHDRPNRLSRARLWMNELNHESNTHSTRVDPKNCLEVTRLGIDEENLPVHTNSISIDTYRDEQSRDGIDTIQKKEFSSPQVNINLVQDSTARGRDNTVSGMVVDPEFEDHQSDDMFNTSERDEIAEITEASSEDTDDNPNESRLSFPTNSTSSELVTPMVVDGIAEGAIGNVLLRPVRENRCDDIHLKNDVGGNDVVEKIPLLPLPSKDVESMDPDIAAAERRLWDKIDLALHEYSGEVMMIEKKKSGLVEASPVTMDVIE